MELPKCPVCLDVIAEDDATKFPGCNHAMHTQCALQCAWKGLVSCPTCRRLPIPSMDPMDVEDNRDQCIADHNQNEMRKLFRKALAAERAGNASRVVQRAVDAYKKHKDMLAQKAKERTYFAQIHRDLKRDINTAFDKLKSKYANKADAAGWNGKTCVNMMSLHPHTRKKCRYELDYKTRRHMRKIARAMGWKPVCDL